MANTFIPEPIDGGDIGIWATKELNQNRLAIGVNTCQLYDDAGTLKLTVGKIGFDNSSIIGVFDMDTIETISIAGVTNFNWAKIELALSGTSPILTATDISGATNPGILPTEFTGSYDPDKGGYYIDSSKRCIGLIWKDSGVLGGFVNALSTEDNYYGYSESDIISFKHTWNNRNPFDNNYAGKIYIIPESDRPVSYILNGGTAATWTQVDFSTYVPYGVKSIILDIRIDMLGDGALDFVNANFRQNGSSETADLKTNPTILYHTNLAASSFVSYVGTKFILCDVNGIIEYQITTGGFLYVTLVGYTV